MKEELENLLLNFSIKTEISVLLVNENEVTYYVGNTEKCTEYLYEKVSDDLKNVLNLRQGNELTILNGSKTLKVLLRDKHQYKTQALYKFNNSSNLIIFFKEEKYFNEEEISLMKSTIYLAEKYFIWSD